MKRQTKTMVVEVKEDGRWVVNTPSLDRDRDHVLPSGGDLTNFKANPVLLGGHDYRTPSAVIGRATKIKQSKKEISIVPEWREAVNDSDPMHIIRALIDQKIVKTMSIGFMPSEWEKNEEGGFDFTQWELLEVSVVPVPSNAEALRLAVKALDKPLVGETDWETISAQLRDILTADGDGRPEPEGEPETDDGEPTSTEPAEPSADTEPADDDAEPQPAADAATDEPLGDNTDDDELTPEEEAALLELFGEFIENITELLGDAT